MKPDAPEEEVDAYIGQIKDLITNGKGTVDKADKWGTRKLAYRVQKYNEGMYVLIQFSSSPELVKEVERRMRVTDMVIKFITVRIDEKTKKIEKRKKQREKRAARRPAPPPMAAPIATGRAGATCSRRTGGRSTTCGCSGPAGARALAAAEAAVGNQGIVRGHYHGGTKRRKTHQRFHRDPPAATRPSRERSSISGARSCAGSASTRSTTSTTRTCGCSAPSSASAARSRRGGFRACARRISGGWRKPSSRRATSRWCRSRRRSKRRTR